MVGGELTVGHSYLQGTGDVPGEDPVSVGLLGADFAIENGHYRIKRIYTRRELESRFASTAQRSGNPGRRR